MGAWHTVHPHWLLDPNLQKYILYIDQHQLMQYKIIHRVHYTRKRLFKMGFTDSDIWSHCILNTTDNYMHATWHCTLIKQFWLDITDYLSSLLGCHIPLSPTLVSPSIQSNINLNNTSSRILSIALTIAKKTILMNWKTWNKINTTLRKKSTNQIYINWTINRLYNKSNRWFWHNLGPVHQHTYFLTWYWFW